jgi:hypothetical protein
LVYLMKNYLTMHVKQSYNGLKTKNIVAFVCKVPSYHFPYYLKMLREYGFNALSVRIKGLD